MDPSFREVAAVVAVLLILVGGAFAAAWFIAWLQPPRESQPRLPIAPTDPGRRRKALERERWRRGGAAAPPYERPADVVDVFGALPDDALLPPPIPPVDRPTGT